MSRGIFHASAMGLAVREKRGDRPIDITAREIGIGPATLWRVEHGYPMSMLVWDKIATYLGLTVGQRG